MELNYGRHKTFKFAADVISNMPDIVITNILDRLPLQYAVRTSVLSRDWRLKWTMLSQLVFDDNFFTYLSKTASKNNHVRIISRILLHLRGAVTKFVLSINDDHVLDIEDINHLILFLWRKGIKDLTLENEDAKTPPLKLPTHIFSCVELKHLKLRRCRFDTPPSFHGFPNLLSLDLFEVQVGSSDQLGEFFTWCPLLESLKVFSTRNINLVEIEKLKNLKLLSLTCFSYHMITNSNTIFQLLSFLPKLQELHLEFMCNWKLTHSGANKRFPTAFPSVETLKLAINLDKGTEVTFALDLIKSFPNLQNFEFKTFGILEDGELCFSEVDLTTGLLQLQNIVFTTFGHVTEREVSLIKYLLSCSPFLKKFVVRPINEDVDVDERLMLAKKLLILQRAYPTVDIDLSQM